jgi:hypothetical protein
MTDIIDEDRKQLIQKEELLYEENNQESKSQQLLKDKGYVYRHNYIFLCLLFIGLVILIIYTVIKWRSISGVTTNIFKSNNPINNKFK